MTDNIDTSNFNKLQERSQQVLNNITQLQTQEKDLYDSLEDASLSPEQKKQIINKINQISQMRMNMYSSMKDMYANYQQGVSSSQSTLDQQMVAIDILENELNDAKQRMNVLQDQKYNKLRLVQINTYYGKRYQSHIQILKVIVIMCVPLIILAVLANKGILPLNLYVFLSGLVLVIGLVIIGLQIVDISNRDNMNWDEYNWYFDQSNAPTESSSSSETTDSSSSSSSNPWTSISTTCIGSACCYEGTTYDESKKVCILNSD